MRFRLLLLCLPVLLGACSKTSRPVQLDFVGASALTSGNRVVAANDTLTTRIFAAGNEDSLRRLRVVVSYSPGLSPIAYPTPTSSFDPKKAPAAQEIVYLDTLIKPAYKGKTPPRGGEYLFNNSFASRSTSGTEQWQYTISDKRSETASRALRLTIHKSDSAAVYHSYTVQLRPVPANRLVPDSVRAIRRVYLNLRTGLLLPKYAVVNREASVQANQKLVDLICNSADGTSVSLNAPTSTDASTLVLNSRQWPGANRNATVLRATRLNETDFAGITTVAAINSAFAASTAFINPYGTGTLAKNQVLAFQVTENTVTYTGLLLVSNLVLGTSPLLTCSVRVTK